MSKILVTDSKGTLGTPLVKELLRRGHEVWGCDLQHQRDENYIRADVSNYRQLERVFEQDYDYVYHLAAEFGRINGEEYYDTLWQTNVIGTRNILELQKNKGFKLIFASSSEIYGDKHADILGEDMPLNYSIIQPNDYAVTKWVNEIQIMNFEKRFGIEAVRCRFFNAYGPGEYYHHYRSVVCLFCYRALFGISWQVYEGYHRVFMYIDDFIPTLANVCEKFIPGEVYNIGGEEFRSVKELSNLILQYTDADPKLVEYLPEDRHNVLNKRPDISKAKKQFRHNPKVILEEGVPITIEWMKRVYNQ
ncbi:MAG: NAD-dependent epimerase/dehydratase [Candidatus Scalindua rubra]|uniref:NAD-dependent epimerase/dehydratase n=1 Tax=Candidatus Scalindua rubra TaxID=1872076 RepID=A0A1E3XAX8_9BACT|nr:MAG: NAD-dependent epimerase/dehydratase [Candidatus Scalindua rubra]